MRSVASKKGRAERASQSELQRTAQGEPVNAHPVAETALALGESDGLYLGFSRCPPPVA